MCQIAIRVAVLVGLTTIAESLDIARCRLALGMQTHQIPDHAIKASSSLNDSSVGPASARVRSEISGGAWCPKEHVSESVYEYLQIDFGVMKVVTLVETQGRFLNGQGQEYVEQYTLEYQRELEGPWFKFTNRRGQKIFQGNTNAYIAELREVEPPIIARAIRFVPYSERPKATCLRVEVYGCSWADGVIWYNMPQGERRSSEIEFRDLTYDGTVEDHYLRGGMGQLMDGEIGQSNFRQDFQKMGIKGYEWVGWKNDSFVNGMVEIIFKFDALRNFSLLTLHCSNLVSKDMRIFRSALVSFSEYENFFPVPSVDYRHSRDLGVEHVRNVVIPLSNAIGRYVKLELIFDSRWMLISEIQFRSEIVKEQTSIDEYPLITTESVSLRSAVDITAFHNLIEVVDVVLERKNETFTKELFLQTFVRSTTKPLVTSHTNNLHREKVLNASTLETKMTDECIGIIIGMLFMVVIILIAVILIVILRHRRQKYATGHQVMKCIEPRHIAVTMNSLRNSRSSLSNGKINNGNIYDFVATSDVDSDQTRTCCGISNMVEFYPELPERVCQLSDMPRLPIASGSITNKDNFVENTIDVPYSLGSLSLSNSCFKTSWTSFNPNSFLSGPALYQDSNDHSFRCSEFAALNQMPFGIYQGLASSATAYQHYLDTNNKPLPAGTGISFSKDFSVVEFPFEDLKLVGKVADWQFGEVHLCDATVVKSFTNSNQPRSPNALLLIIKMTRRPTDEQMKTEFWKEVRIMSQLNDDNVIQMMGICSVEEPMCILYEYLRYGDLKQFLQQYNGIECNFERPGDVISYGTLVYMASQIASGMKHLEMLNIVHRDLAARNCLVGEHYTIKVSDLGTSRNIYADDYYAIDEKIALPIRWMSWEFLFQNKFSSKSDVWAFGVAMWEILSLAKEKPFADMTDHQVLENHSHYYAGDRKEIFPYQPFCCPREIYDLLQECWNRDETSRPTFREIHMFLQRKNMGYIPQHDENRQNTLTSVLV